MSPTQLLLDSHFLVVLPDPDTPYELPLSLSEIENLIVSNGGTFVTVTAENSLNSIADHNINHVLTQSYHFAGYLQASKRLVPITSFKWLTDSIAIKQRKNYRLYLPTPAPPMAGILICAANNLPQGDKDLMYTATRLFGGHYLDMLSGHTTHLISVDQVNGKALVTAHLVQKRNMAIDVVLPSWFARCLELQRIVSVQPYLLLDPVVSELGQPNSRLLLEDELQIVSSSHVLAGKRVHISTDFDMSKMFLDSVEALITSNGGLVVSEFDPDNIDILVAKYRDGDRFKRCCADDRIDVGLILWLFHVISSGRYINPLQLNLLHYPIPKTHISEFKNLRISITGINGDARYYLVSLITAMGASFTKTLDAKNDILVSGSAISEKHQTVQNRWSNIKLVNYLWIEDCFANWKYMDLSADRYSLFDNQQQPLGDATLSSEIVRKCTDLASDLLGIDDSAAEDIDENVRIATDNITGVDVNAARDNVIGEDIDDDVQQETNAEEPVSNAVNGAQTEQLFPSVDIATKDNESLSFKVVSQTEEESNAAVKVFSDVSQIEEISTNPEQISVVELNDTSSSPIHARASRSAKQKASLKLHSDMEDLNKYMTISKSSKKMKDYMDQLERASEKAKKRPSGVDDSSIQEVKEVPSKKKVKTDLALKYVTILTGCEQIFVPSRADTAKLAKVGISIVNDFNSSKKVIDTIVAPKVLRTEKFLKSLSQAHRIIHPNYLTDILSYIAVNGTQVIADDLHNQISVDDYSLDKVLSVKQVNEELGYEGSGNGLTELLSAKSGNFIFDQLRFNLSTNLNGGPALIESILRAHGLRASKTIKVLTSMSKRELLTSPDGNAVIVTNKKKDPKCQIEGVVLVDWNWCVECIFHGKILPYQ